MSRRLRIIWGKNNFLYSCEIGLVRFVLKKFLGLVVNVEGIVKVFFNFISLDILLKKICLLLKCWYIFVNILIFFKIFWKFFIFLFLILIRVVVSVLLNLVFFCWFFLIIILMILRKFFKFFWSKDKFFIVICLFRRFL